MSLTLWNWSIPEGTEKKLSQNSVIDVRVQCSGIWERGAGNDGPMGRRESLMKSESKINSKDKREDEEGHWGGGSTMDGNNMGVRGQDLFKEL